MKAIADDVKAFQARLQADLDRRREEHGPLPVEEAPRFKCRRCKGAGHLSLPYNPEYNTKMELVPCPDCSSGPPAPEIIQRRIMASGMDHKPRTRFDLVKPYDWQLEYWRVALDYVMRPHGWLWLTGGWGVGKTTLSFCIGNEWLDAGKHVMFRVVPSMLRELKAGNARDAELSYNDMLLQVMAVPLLILDDYGKQSETSWDSECLFQLTDHRLEHNLPTVVTTNLTLDQLGEQQGRLFTRVVDAKRVTVVNFPDMNPEDPF